MIFSMFASADIQIEQDSVTVNVNYADFNDEDQKTISQSTEQFTIKNTGTENETITVIATNIPTDYPKWKP